VYLFSVNYSGINPELWYFQILLNGSEIWKVTGITDTFVGDKYGLYVLVLNEDRTVHFFPSYYDANAKV